MFIELTDHLRCPGDHAEGFLVLLPDRIDGRRVVSGILGCPICGREFPIVGGEGRLGPPSLTEAGTELTAPAIRALGGIEGPGGYLLVIGGPGALAGEIAAEFEGVRVVLVNPPEAVSDSAEASVLRSDRLPIKRGSMRLVVCGRLESERTEWLEPAIEAVLPGNRIVCEGTPVERPGLEVLAEAGGVWVGRRR